MYHLTFACCIYYTMCYITKWSLPLKHEDSNSEEHTAGSSKCAVPWWDPGIRASSKGAPWREALHLAIWDLHWGLTCQSVTVRTLLHLSIIPVTQTAGEATAILHSWKTTTACSHSGYKECLKCWVSGQPQWDLTLLSPNQDGSLEPLGRLHLLSSQCLRQKAETLVSLSYPQPSSMTT